MGIFNSILAVIQIIKELFNFIVGKVEEFKRKEQKKAVDDLKEKVKEDTKKGNIPDLNKNIRL